MSLSPARESWSSRWLPQSPGVSIMPSASSKPASAVSATLETLKKAPIQMISLYLEYAGPTRPWAIAAHLAEFGVQMPPTLVTNICDQFAGTFLRDRDHIGPLIGLRTAGWVEEVRSRYSLRETAHRKEQVIPRMTRATRL